MPAASPKPGVHTTPSDSTRAVDDFMRKLDHPFKREIQAIREIIRNVHPSIAEGGKWNAPSFRTTEYFATINLRAKNGVGVILHFGAKVRHSATTGVPINAPKKPAYVAGKRPGNRGFR